MDLRQSSKWLVCFIWPVCFCARGKDTIIPLFTLPSNSETRPVEPEPTDDTTVSGLSCRLPSPSLSSSPPHLSCSLSFVQKQDQLAQNQLLVHIPPVQVHHTLSHLSHKTSSSYAYTICMDIVDVHVCVYYVCIQRVYDHFPFCFMTAFHIIGR